MKRHGLENAPPLRVWIYAILLALLLWVGMLFNNAHAEAVREDHFLRQCRTDIRALHNGVDGGNSRLVILLGTSLMEKVTRNLLWEEQSSSYGLQNLRFLKMTLPMSNLYHFLPVMDELLEKPPDLLLIESDLLFNVEYHSRFSLKYLMMLPKSIMLRIMSPLRRKNHFRVLHRNPERILARRLKTIQVQMGRLTVARGPFAGMVSRLRSRGVRVVIVEIPRSAPVDKVKREVILSRHGAFVDFVKRSCGVPWLVYPEPLSPSWYSDSSHLTPRGARRFLSWLIPEIRNLLAGGMTP